MYRWYFIKTHFKNHKGIIWTYCLIYIFLILFSVAYFYCNPVDSIEGIVHKYADSMEIVHIVVCILGAFPMIFLTREIFERKKYPYVIIYSYDWARIDNFLAHICSLIFPAILLGIIAGLYRNTELEVYYYSGMLLVSLLQHVILVFFLSSLGFCIGILTRSYSMSMLIVLAYVLLLQYMGLPGVVANFVTLDFGETWLWGTGMIFFMAIVLNELGLLMLNRKGKY